MSEYLIHGETLIGIADAIREKTGGTDPVAVSDMAAQIEGIQAGGGDSADSIIDRSVTSITSNAAAVGQNAFSSCTALTTVNFPVAINIGGNAFSSCISLKTVDIPVATNIEAFAFSQCTALETASFPSAETIGFAAFEVCESLNTIDFPVATNIETYAFNSCRTLGTVIIRTPAVCTLSTINAFESTLIESGEGYIYVPAALVDSYKAETNWSTYAAQFRALEDYTVDGTITGELDPAKTGT